MLNRIKALFMNSRNETRDSYAWNMTQSMLFAVQSVILLMVINRTNTLDDSGVFSIAYAVASLIFYIGEFGVRRYQVTDINEKASFADYHTHRVITCLAAMIAALVYSGVLFSTGQYNEYKFLIVVIVCSVKVLEAYCDVYFSRYQQKGRLDVAAKASTYRIIVPIAACMISLIVTRDLLISMIVWLVMTVIAILTSFILVAPEFGKIEFQLNADKFMLITRECLPLFAGNFLILYVGNAPKYAIDACLDDKAQACFNFIFMPVFVIGLLANFVFNPILVRLARAWNEGNRKTFNMIVQRQIGVIIAITLLAVAVALTIGCPVLGLMFNADLTGSRWSLTILMIGGGMLALANFLIVIVTVIRKQKYLMPGYIAAAAAAKLLSEHFVTNYGVPGASVLYACLMTLASLFFAVVLIISIRKADTAQES